MDLSAFIRDIPDFPKPGVLFKDITPLLREPGALRVAVEQMAAPFRDEEIDLVCGAESRGFIFGTVLAQQLEAGFVPLRKPGRLPAEVWGVDYELEYRTGRLEVHADAIHPGQRVLMVDDLLATGGTMKAGCDLVEASGGRIVGISVLIELLFLQGRRRLKPYPNLHALMAYGQASDAQG